jgi:hypothetical protein
VTICHPVLALCITYTTPARSSSPPSVVRRTATPPAITAFMLSRFRWRLINSLLANLARTQPIHDRLKGRSHCVARQGRYDASWTDQLRWLVEVGEDRLRIECAERAVVLGQHLRDCRAIMSEIRTAADQWSLMNWARTLLGCAGVFCSMRALDLYYNALIEKLGGR